VRARLGGVSRGYEDASYCWSKCLGQEFEAMLREGGWEMGNIRVGWVKSKEEEAWAKGARWRESGGDILK
jgi:hypothetical protein